MCAQTSHLDPRQGRLNTVLIDNASIHHCHEFVERITLDHKCIVRYMPPYCHFLSPLDNGAFGALVQWLQRNYDYVQSVGMAQAMEDGMRTLNLNQPGLARYCFRNCQYL